MTLCVLKGRGPLEIRGVLHARPHNEAGHIPWVISFLATCSPLISGKHLPGITSDACSGPGPHHRYVACGPQLRWFRAIVPFVVGRDYAMWATITVKQKMRPTSERNPGPHHTGICGPHPMESPAHIDRNTQEPLIVILRTENGGHVVAYGLIAYSIQLV